MIPAKTRRFIRVEYGFACGYCGVTETEVGALLTLDHFEPVDAGGSDEISNLVYACHACNLHKSSAWNPQNPPVLHPLRVEMPLHIRALPDGKLEGLTPEGIRHIEALHLNRFPLVERRRRLRLLEALLEQQTQRVEQAAQIEQNIKRRKGKLRRHRPPRA